MSKFMLILHDSNATTAAWRELSPQQIQEALGKYMTWTQNLAQSGKLVHCEKLKEEGGRRLQQKNGKLSVVDGPYAEAKEVVGGYYMVEAKDYAAAVEIARTCPHLTHGGVIDVREVDPVMPE